MPHTPQVETKWQQMGAYLKGRVKVNPSDPDYATLSIEELKSRKQKAEAWLKEHENHKKYASSLERYEHICDYLTLKENLL